MNDTAENKSFPRSPCPVTNALDIVGDKWTLILLRNMCMGQTRYKQFQQALEKFPTNILADRLRRLEEFGLVEKQPYQEKPRRYEYHLTAKGRDMIPVIQELARWSLKHIEGCWQPPESFWTLGQDGS